MLHIAADGDSHVCRECSSTTGISYICDTDWVTCWCFRVVLEYMHWHPDDSLKIYRLGPVKLKAIRTNADNVRDANKNNSNDSNAQSYAKYCYHFSKEVPLCHTVGLA